MMASLRAGDPDALQWLVEQYWQELVIYVRRLLDDKDAAEDVVQEAFVRLWEQRARWWASTVPRAVLYRIARNLALNEIKAEGFRERQLRLQHRWLGAPLQTPIQVLECEELHQAVIQAVHGLPTRRREVFVLARFHGLTYREIAETLDIAPQTVANQMTAALATLHGALSRFRDMPVASPA